MLPNANYSDQETGSITLLRFPQEDAANLVPKTKLFSPSLL